MSTQKQIAANRANAQLSTGPTSSTGLAKTSLNAVKTGLTGRTVLLPTDDVAAYESLVASFFKKHEPSGDDEHTLVQSLADTEWRLIRIPSLEAGIYALGSIELAAEFADQPAELRPALIQAKIFMTHQRQLNNLSIQESRLRRNREKDLAALRELQEKRRVQESADRRKRLNAAARQYIQAVHESRHELWEPGPNGFEFSLEEVEIHALKIQPDLFREWTEAHKAQRAA